MLAGGSDNSSEDYSGVSVDIPGIFLIVQRFEAPLVGAGIMQKDILYYLAMHLINAAEYHSIIYAIHKSIILDQSEYNT